MKLHRSMGHKLRVPQPMWDEIESLRVATRFRGRTREFALWLLGEAIKQAHRELQGRRLVQPASPQLAAKMRSTRGQKS